MEHSLGKRIAENRKRLKLTQDQLAEKLGVTAQAVSKWENDQSCPDITTLPKLAEIFGISTDELLGYTSSNVVHEAEVVEDEESENDGIHIQKGNWEIRWDNSKLYSLGFAVLVLSVGLLYLLSQILVWELTFWDILWPTSLLVFGIWGLFEKLSFLRLGCALFGGYALASKLFYFSFSFDGKLIWAVLILLFGASLLADAIKKPRRPVFSIHGPSTKNHINKNSYQCTDNTFTYDCSFGEKKQNITLETLQYGEIRVSFGEYTVNLSEVKNITSDCTIYIQCSFGELHLIVPSRYEVISEPHGAFSNIEVIGSPEETSSGVLRLDGTISFGELEIEYI